jgi:hypothetical protein
VVLTLVVVIKEVGPGTVWIDVGPGTVWIDVGPGTVLIDVGPTIVWVRVGPGIVFKTVTGTSRVVVVVRYEVMIEVLHEVIVDAGTASFSDQLKVHTLNTHE